jgi:hypothetical protein
MQLTESPEMLFRKELLNLTSGAKKFSFMFKGLIRQALGGVVSMNTDTSILLLLHDSRSSDAWLLEGAGLTEAVLDPDVGYGAGGHGGKEIVGPTEWLEARGPKFAGESGKSVGWLELTVPVLEVG